MVLRGKTLSAACPLVDVTGREPAVVLCGTSAVTVGLGLATASLSPTSTLATADGGVPDTRVGLQLLSPTGVSLLFSLDEIDAPLLVLVFSLVPDSAVVVVIGSDVEDVDAIVTVVVVIMGCPPTCVC